MDMNIFVVTWNGEPFDLHVTRNEDPATTVARIRSEIDESGRAEDEGPVEWETVVGFNSASLPEWRSADLSYRIVMFERGEL